MQSDDALPHPEGTVEEVESLAGPDSCQRLASVHHVGCGHYRQSSGIKSVIKTESHCPVGIISH